MKSDVYFVKVESPDLEARQEALKRLLTATAPLQGYNNDEIVPIKLTIGDSACVRNVHPELVKLVVAHVKKQGAKPFLFDTSVIYKGERQNAVDHMNLAQSKGFGHARVGAAFIVADGVFGQDGKEFTVAEGHIHKIKTPSFVGMVDNLVVISHVTGHIVSAYAGAIKNVAMGMACKPTKQVQHSSLKPSVVVKKCTACGCCVALCPAKAVTLEGEKAFINPQKCVGCGECLCACKFDAIYINWHEEPLVFCQRMVEVAGCILSKFKRAVFVNFALDITKECDCISTKDEPMVSDTFGILASCDSVSIDKATADLALSHKQTEYFPKNQKLINEALSYAAKRGLGNLAYNLIEL